MNATLTEAQDAVRVAFYFPEIRPVALLIVLLGRKANPVSVTLPAYLLSLWSNNLAILPSTTRQRVKKLIHEVI